LTTDTVGIKIPTVRTWRAKKGGGVSEKIRLYGFTGSNSVYTGRLLLEHKGLDYTFVKVPPAAHAVILLAMRFPTMGAPALKIGKRRIQGTRWIARALDELYPDKPLFPADPELRREVVRAERWGEELQNATRRLFYCCARRDKQSFLSVLGSGRGPVKAAAIRVMAPFIIRLATGAHRANDEAGREDVAMLVERLDQVDAWIAQGVLGGEQLNAADFQIAVNVSGLALFEDLRPFIEGRPAAALARRVAPDYAGSVAPVLPEEWLAVLRAAAQPSSASAAAATAAPNRLGGAGGDPTRRAAAVRSSL
jgi:glutathione S-transferase